MINTGSLGRLMCCQDIHSHYVSMDKEFLFTRLTQQSGGSPMDTHTSSLETGAVCWKKKRLSKNMPLLSMCLHTSSWLCTDTGDTMRRLGVQTATSLSQTADGAGFLTHPKEPSSVMTAVNSDLKIIKYSPLVGRMERLLFVSITTDTQSCTYSVESRKTA